MRGGSRGYTGPMIDAHHHLWDVASNPYPWLADAPPGSLEARLADEWGHYDADDYRAEMEGLRLAGSVHVQAEWDPSDPAGETGWLQAEHDRSGLPSAIVGAARLESAEFPRVLDAHRAHPSFRGIRQMLNWADDPALRIAPRDDLMTDRAWRRGFELLTGLGLSFDLQVYPGQLKEAARLAHAYPAASIVLCHAGAPDEAAPDRAVWREGLQRLAECPNVSVKLSGITQPERSVEQVTEYVEDVLAVFACDRAMFGTNLPVEHLQGSPAVLVEALDRALEGRDDAERAAVWCGTAVRVYRLELDAGSR